MQGKMKYSEQLFLYELRDIVGDDNVYTDSVEKKSQALDVWWITRYSMFNDIEVPEPLAIVFPENKKQVMAVVKLCNYYDMPVIPRGGGAGDGGGTLAITGGIVLDLKKMDKIVALNEKSLTVLVQPGILQKHLEEYLNRYGYTMNHFPASYHTSAVGGFISTNGTGVLSSKYGKLIDMVRKIEVVLPDGKLFTSLPVSHHSTGPDFSKLFIGAEGVFGVVTEALIKIHPLPEKRSFLAYLLPDLEEGIEAGRKIMVNGLLPCIMRFYDQKDTEHILTKQYNLEAKGCFFMVGFDGVGSVVDAQTTEAEKIFKQAGGVDLGDQQAWKWWNNRLKSYYPPLDYVCEPWMTAVTDTVASYEEIEKVYWAMKSVVEDGFKEYGAVFHAHFSHWYDWGASFYPTFLVKDIPEDKEKALDVYHKMLSACARASIENGGVVNEHHGIGIRNGRFIKEIYGEQSFSMIRDIKNAIDPKRILNPGKLGL
jgi:alkyldihydroxyacetonephosphate synthase